MKDWVRLYVLRTHYRCHRCGSVLRHVCRPLHDQWHKFAGPAKVVMLDEAARERARNTAPWWMN